MRAPATLVLVFLVVLPGAAAEGGPVSDPLLAAMASDPLELARLTARLGDEAVLARLDSARPSEVRLAGVRAARWLHEPERALEPLVELAAGRDPDLAPAAALAAFRIARGLEPEGLARRERDRGAVEAPAAQLERLAGEEGARPDVRRLAAFAVIELGDLAASLGTASRDGRRRAAPRASQ